MGREILSEAVVQHELRLDPQSCPPGSSDFPAMLQGHPLGSGAFLQLPCDRAAWSNRLVDLVFFFLQYLLIIFILVLCSRRETEKPEWPNMFVKPPRDLLEFSPCWLSGTGLEKKRCWKTTQLCWVRRILNLLCRKHWVPYGALKGLTYRVIHTLTPCYILEISFSFVFKKEKKKAKKKANFRAKWSALCLRVCIGFGFLFPFFNFSSFFPPFAFLKDVVLCQLQKCSFSHSLKFWILASAVFIVCVRLAARLGSHFSISKVLLKRHQPLFCFSPIHTFFRFTLCIVAHLF